jgi:ADP-ribose pyrophosphatase
MEYKSKATVGNPKCLIESKFLKVQQHNVRVNERIDEVIEDWIWIDYHDRINVLIEAPQSIKGKEPQFLVLEQTKYALEDRTSLAIVGGIIEPGEQPKDAALREVLEETGNKCDRLDFLGRYRTDVNRGMGWTNTFIASMCKQSTNTALHAIDEIGKSDTEKQDFITMSLSQLREAVIAGKFLEIQWSATVALALLHYENSGHSV